LSFINVGEEDAGDGELKNVFFLESF